MNSPRCGDGRRVPKGCGDPIPGGVRGAMSVRASAIEPPASRGRVSFNADGAASPPAPDRRGQASAGRADDALAGRAPDPHRTARFGSPRTNPRRARSCGSTNAQPRARAGSRAARATSHSSRCGRIERNAADETTIPQLRGIPRSRVRRAAPSDQLLGIATSILSSRSVAQSANGYGPIFPRRHRIRTFAQAASGRFSRRGGDRAWIT